MSRRRSPSRRRVAIAGGLAAAALVAAIPRAARAQACCAGGTVLTPGRLNLHEDALVGLLVKGTAVTGSFDGKGRFASSPKGDVEADFEQDVIASLRVLSRGQVTVLVPIEQTYRREGGLGDFGGGIGDLQVSARWDATLTGASLTIPGVAVLASLILPTGVPPELATHPLTADATGVGTVRGGLGLALEQTFGKVLVNVTSSATLSSARTIQGIHTQLGPTFNVFGAVGYSFEPGPVAAITASYTASLDSKTDGAPVSDSARTQLQLGVATGYAFNDSWRMQAAVFGTPPAPSAGENMPQGVGASATLFHTW